MKSWRTTLFGLAAIAYALWLLKDTYVPWQTWRFNLAHVWPTPIALILIGIGLIHAKDHKSP